MQEKLAFFDFHCSFRMFDFRFCRPLMNTDDLYARWGLAGSMLNIFPVARRASADGGLNAAQVRALGAGGRIYGGGAGGAAYSGNERDAERFEEWVGAGHAGTMRYLERRNDGGPAAAVAGGDSVSMGALGGRLLCGL